MPQNIFLQDSAKCKDKIFTVFCFSSRPENCAETLLNNVFRLLPQEAFDVKLKKPIEYFSTKPKLSFGGLWHYICACVSLWQHCLIFSSPELTPFLIFSDPWTSTFVEHLASDVLFGALCCLPALTRVWWTSSEPKVASLVDQVVSKHLSPLVCSADLAAVAKMQDKTVENMSVSVKSLNA